MTTRRLHRVGLVSLLATLAGGWTPASAWAFQDATEPVAPGVESAAVAGPEVDLAGAAAAVRDEAMATGAQDAAAPDGGDVAADAQPVTRAARRRFPRPEHVRGIYANAWASGSRGRMEELIALIRRTEINSLVIDIKDATGFISHNTQVPLAHEIGATREVRIADLPGLLDRLEAEGIYPIARIVIVKDPIVAKYRPEMAVQDTAGGVWIDSKGIVWLNAFNREVWDYHVDLAREVALMGFPEIQFDYVRFPDAPQADMDRAVFEGSNGRAKPTAIREFLRYARARLDELGVETTADVFGVTTSADRDVGIGQVWETFIDVVDVALPMVYPSHYWEGSFGYSTPNARPYEVVRRAVSDALARSRTVQGAGITRPWLQDFSLGEPIYGGAEVRAQIQATYDAGAQEWILWNPGSRYTESALEPVDGFEREPLVRVAGRLVPVSERFNALNTVSALPNGESADAPGAPVQSTLPDS